MATIDIKLKTYEQLQFEIMKLNTDIILKDKEIERLNNIINELEKWLKEQREFIQTIDMMPNLKEIKLEHKIMFNDYNNILDKLKELKGETNE